MKLNLPVVRLLIQKDWQLFQKQLALFVLGGIVALALIGLARPWSFYLGSLLLIVVLVAAACFSISTALVEERKQQTLAFVMSLPVAPIDFTAAKLGANLLTFGVPFCVLLAGTLACILLTPLPNGLTVLACLLFAYVLFAYSLSLAVAMSVESEGWNIFTMIGSMVMINPFLMGLSQIEAISGGGYREATVSWSAPALGILFGLLAATLVVFVATAWHHARKPAFY